MADLSEPEDENGIPLKYKRLKGGMSKDEIDRAAVFDGSKRSPNMRPKDSATVIILDDSGPEIRLLLGRRHENHKFMPGLFVFPGGRVDRYDGSVAAGSELEPAVQDRIVSTLRGKPTARRARALALAAIRETYEEAGLFLGEKRPGFSDTHGDWQAFTDEGVMPTLAPFRIIARAITPPGRSRRFDAWFFITKASHIAHRLPEGTGPSGELQDLHWMTIEEAKQLELPVITVTVLDELQQRLKEDPALKPGYKAPFFHMRGKTFLRELI
ncbi:MAG: NUDIX hydrolase [Pseudomonadota bacterium]